MLWRRLFLKDLRKDGELYLDGKLAMKNGKWLVIQSLVMLLVETATSLLVTWLIIL